MAESGFENLVKSLPKTEVHLHFEGTIPWKLVRRWSEDDVPKAPPWWDPEHRFESFADFLGAMRVGWRGLITGLDRVEAVAREIFQGLVTQNVRYVEISFGLGAYDDPVDSVAATIKRAAPEGLVVRVIGGISRDRDPRWMRDLSQEAVEAPNLDGIDLHGDEKSGGLGRFSDVFHAAQRMGKITKAHAGEFGDLEIVQRTLEVLNVRRIEHGISAVRNRAVMEVLMERGVTLDVCPWSNVKLGNAPSLEHHPLKTLHAVGIRATVNTDDPTIFGQTLSEEIGWLHTQMGLTVHDVVEIVKNGFRIARMDPDGKAACMAEADAAFQEYEKTTMNSEQ